MPVCHHGGIIGGRIAKEKPVLKVFCAAFKTGKAAKFIKTVDPGTKKIK